MATYNLGRVVGPQGDPGETGNGIASTTLNQDYTLTINYTNGDSDTTSSIRGEKGETGAPGKDGEDYVITQADYQAIADVVESEVNIPTKTSDLTNDSGFITNAVNDLTNYYLRSNTYTKDEVNTLIGNIETISMTVVSELPSEGESNVIYLVPSADPQTQNVKDEYIWVNSAWEQIGSTAIDLSDYQTKIDSTHKLDADLVDDTSSTNKFVTSSEKTTWNAKSDFSGDYEDLTNKPTIPVVPTNVSAFTNDAGYTTNTGTITSVKMNGSTIATSGEADLGTVITSHQDISGKEDKTNKVTSLTSTSTNTEYPSAKAVYDAISGVGNLNYKGHVATTDDLPSTGQPSATAEAPVVTLTSSSQPTNGGTYRLQQLKNYLGSTYNYYIGGCYEYSGGTHKIGLITNYSETIDGFSIVKDDSTYYLMAHVSYDVNKPIYWKGSWPVGITDDSTGQITQTFSANTTVQINYSGWLPVGAIWSLSNSAHYYIFSNLANIKFKYCDISTVSWAGDPYTISTKYKTVTNPSSYNYIDNYKIFEFTGEIAQWVGANPSPDAVENAVYTVGDTYEIYRCNSTPAWEHWSESSGGGGSSTDVQINGTSITSQGVANIVTETAYDASTNKIATMSDVPTITPIYLGKTSTHNTEQTAIDLNALPIGVYLLKHDSNNNTLWLKATYKGNQAQPTTRTLEVTLFEDATEQGKPNAKVINNQIYLYIDKLIDVTSSYSSSVVIGSITTTLNDFTHSLSNNFRSIRVRSSALSLYSHTYEDFAIESTNNKVTSLSSSSTDTEYPSAKCVYDLINSDILHYKGHVSSVGDLPSTGQPSAVAVSPVYTYTGSYIASDDTTKLNELKTYLSSDNYPYFVGSHVTYSYGSTTEKMYAGVCSEYPDMIDGFAIINGNSPSTFYAVHFKYDTNKDVYIKGPVPTIYYDDGTTETASSATFKKVSKSGWIGLWCQVSTYTEPCIFSSMSNIKMMIPTGIEKMKYSSYESYLNASQYNTITHNDYNYVEGSKILSFNNGLSSWVTATPSPDAVENNVYTVGSNYEIYRCNDQPVWEHWSAPEVTKEYVDDLVGDIESLLSEV